MSSFPKKQVLLAISLMVSSFGVFCDAPIFGEYHYKRLNGQVMPSTGESKTVTIEIPVSKVPLYVFLDYNGRIPLSQRLEITSESSKAEVTLLPASLDISVSVVPQSDVHTYLNFMEAYNAEKMQEQKKAEALMDKGVQIIKQPVVGQPWFTSPVNDPVYQQNQNKLQANMKRIATIMYDKITQGQVIQLPNPFEEVKAEEPMIMAQESAAQEPSIEEVAAEEPAVEEPAVEEPAVEEPAVEEPAVEEPLVEEPLVEESLMQPEMMQPNASDIMSTQGNETASSEVADESVADESVADESKEDELKENEE